MSETIQNCKNPTGHIDTLKMPFHHQTAKNISSKKKTSERFELSACHLVEQTRFQANAVISEGYNFIYHFKVMLSLQIHWF